MSKNTVILGFLAATLAACTGGAGTGSTSQASTVVLDVRCAADAECPSGFECETEEEHGAASSYCVSHEDHGTSTGVCPAGYEQEIEHAETFCKPHGGGSDDDGTSDDSSSSDDDPSGGDDSAPDAGAGSAPEGSECASDADCAAGLECEIQIENGVTTSFCKAHGGNKG